MDIVILRTLYVCGGRPCSGEEYLFNMLCRSWLGFVFSLAGRICMYARRAFLLLARSLVVSIHASSSHLHFPSLSLSLSRPDSFSLFSLPLPTYLKAAASIQPARIDIFQVGNGAFGGQVFSVFLLLTVNLPSFTIWLPYAYRRERGERERGEENPWPYS